MKAKEIEKELFLSGAHEPVSFQQALDYELHSHRLTFRIWSSYPAQHVMIRYMSWKTARKYKRYRRARTISIW